MARPSRVRRASPPPLEEASPSSALSDGSVSPPPPLLEDSEAHAGGGAPTSERTAALLRQYGFSEAATAAILAAEAAGFTLPPGAIPLEPESDEPTSDEDGAEHDETHATIATAAGDDAAHGDGGGGDDAQADSATCQWKGCGKVFHYLEPYIEHINEDHLSNHRTLTCEWAGCSRSSKAPMSRFAFNSHLRSHTGEKPYACPRPECDKSFARSDALSKHLKQSHFIQPIPNRRTIASAKKNRARQGNADDDDDGEGGGAEAGPSTGGAGDGADDTRARDKAEDDFGLAHGLGPNTGLSIGTDERPFGAVEMAATAAQGPFFHWGKGIPPHHELLQGFNYADGGGPPLREALSAADYADLEDEAVLHRARMARKRAREAAHADEADQELLLSEEPSSDEDEESLAALQAQHLQAAAQLQQEEEESKGGRTSKRGRLSGSSSAVAATPRVSLPPRKAALSAADLISNSLNPHTNGSGSTFTPTGASLPASSSSSAALFNTQNLAATLSRTQNKYLLAKAKMRHLAQERAELERELAAARAEAIEEKKRTTAALERVLVSELGPDVSAIFSPEGSPVLSPLAL